MNALPYEVKRAHWNGTWDAIRWFRARAGEIGQPSLRDMTPARFDVLYVAWRADEPVHERRRQLGLDPIERRIPMAELRELLGLAGSTVSRIAHRLQELRYVRIVPHERDARAVVVVLTKLGAKLLRLAVDCIRHDPEGVRSRICRYVHDQTLDRSSRQEPGVFERVLENLAMAIDSWRGYARFFGCTAVPIYDTRFVTHLRPHAHSMLVGWGDRNVSYRP